MSNFILNAYTHYKNTGAVCPSSPQLIQKIIEVAQLQEKKHVVELGPGSGVITEALIKHKNPETTYFGIDINPTFIESVSRKIPDAVIYNDSAEAIQKYLTINGIKKTDCIVSSLPWANFKPEFQRSLLKLIKEALTDDGVFITYAYTLGLYFANGKSFRKCLQSEFSRVEKSSTIWSNVPPAFLYISKK